MRGYILSVRENYAGLANLLPAQVAEVRNADGQSGQHLRLPNATAILYAAFDCALNYAVTIGVITPSEAQKRCADFRLVLQALAAEQSEATEAENPARKYMTIIATLLATDRAYLTGKGAQANIGNAMAEKLGWHDGNRAYLLPNAYNTVCKYAAAEGWHFPSDENTLRNELYQAGYLIKTDEKRLTRLQRVPGESANRQHVIVLDRAKLMELLTSMGYESAEPTD